MIPTILDGDLPLLTAVKAAIERNQILQCDGNRMVLHDRLLPGFTRLYSAGERPIHHTPEAA